jgi:dipeptidase E
MPIVDPLGFDTLNLVPFQINPHYLDAHPDGHAGETRQQRIEEFIEINRTTPVIGLREGSMLNIESGNMRLLGEKSAPLFRYSHDVVELEPGSDLSWLLKNK